VCVCIYIYIYIYAYMYISVLTSFQNFIFVLLWQFSFQHVYSLLNRDTYFYPWILESKCWNDILVNRSSVWLRGIPPLSVLCRVSQPLYLSGFPEELILAPKCHPLPLQYLEPVPTSKRSKYSDGPTLWEDVDIEALRRALIRGG